MNHGDECTIQLLDSGRVLEGVKERMVETVVPRVGERVMVLKGEYKGEIGILRASDDKSARVDVDGEILSYDLDDVCEISQDDHF